MRVSGKLFLLALELIFIVEYGSAKPADASQRFPGVILSVPSSKLRTESQQKPSIVQSRRVVTSWNDEGDWQASARLPSSSQTGGNDHSSTKDLTNTRTVDTDKNSGRFNRRLHKWDKTEELLSDETETEGEEGDGSNLAQSLSSMASHLLDKGDESLENSSERDVFINKNKEEVNNENTDETSSDEENDGANPTNNPKTTPWQDETEDDRTEEDKIVEKQKSDGSPTTPKGLTTWSAVNGGGNAYIKGSVQKIPSDFTVSSALSFSTERPGTTLEILTKDRSTFPTTEIPRTTKANLATTPTTRRRKPYYKNKKVVAPSKFVKPQLSDVTAEAIGTDATHTIYKTKVVNAEPESKITSPQKDNYYPYNTTKRPQWPYQTTRRVTTRRPIAAFQKITNKPNKSPYGLNTKKPQMPHLTLTTPTTTTPASTTTYHRNPAPLMYPFPSISFTNLGFMDFLRSQIIPRIGLSLISFMAASPLILSMLGASAVGRRKKRSVLDFVDNGKAQFQTTIRPKIKPMPNFDFTTIKKKLHKLEMIQYKKPEQKKTLIATVAEMVNKFMNTKTFLMLKSSLLKRENDKKNEKS